MSPTPESRTTAAAIDAIMRAVGEKGAIADAQGMAPYLEE